MQCPSCQFFNVPGAAACGRCGSTLRPDALAIDVHPPRATATAKWLRRWLPMPALYRVRDEARQARRGVRRTAARTGFAPPAPGTIPRMLVPGWPLLHVREVFRGRLFLGAYLALLVTGLALLGTFFGSVCLGLAFGVHVASCLAVLRLGGMDAGALRFSALFVILGLFGAVYLPAAWLVTRVATPLTLDYAVPPFAPGDVLLMSRASGPPRPGDVVLHRQRQQMYRAGGMGPNYMIAEGEVIDRVLAGPGDAVRWEQGRLWVNGRPSPLAPLNPDRVPAKLAWSVPPGHYLILPTASVALDPRVTADVWQGMSLIRADDVFGRVYFRTHPLTRWGLVR
jgi:hypothetical protein